MREYGPCKDCKDRTAENPELGTKDCHSGCDRYREWKQQHTEKKKKIRRARMLESMATTRPWMKNWKRGKEAAPDDE